MAAEPLVFNRFEGGLATDGKVGIPNCSGPAIVSGEIGTYGVDFRKSPSQVSVLPGLVWEDGGVVTDLLQNAVMAPNGLIYAIGNTGNLYVDNDTIWSLLGNFGSNGAFGMSYRGETDSLYIAGQTTVHSAYPMAGPTINIYSNKYGASYSTYDNSAVVGFNVKAYQSGSSNAYTPPVTLSEAEVDRRYFQIDIEPLEKISLYILNKGTGDWTVTLRDGTDQDLATITVTNANLTNNAWNDFVLSSPLRMYIAPNARTYHLHVTSTVADGSLSCGTGGDFRTADLQLWASRLIATTNGMHPWTRFLEYECIGNDNYLSVWEPLSEPPTNEEWQRHRLVFPQEYEVCGLAVFNEYLAIALQKSYSGSTADSQEGLIAWWDGLTLTTDQRPNYFTKIPEGTPQCIQTYKNNIYYYAGGDWWRINSPAAQPEKVRRMQGSDSEFSSADSSITVYPYCAAVRRGILLMGYPSVTTSTAPNFGIYSWGGVDRNFHESFGYSYKLGTGSTNYSSGNNLTIGMVKSFGDYLMVSWRDDSNTPKYGVDTITNFSLPAANSSWESIIFDNGLPTKRKKALYIKAIYNNLPTGVTFKLKYKLDRGSWVTSSDFTSTSSTENANIARFDIHKIFNEIQIGCDITCTTDTSTPPEFTGFVLAFDNCKEELLT